MKILITGAGGWLGSELTERLLEEGNEVRAFVLFSSEKLNVLKDKFNHSLEIVEGDVCNKDDVTKVLKDIEVVYHLAAKVHSLPKNEEDKKQFFRINTEASKQLFDLCVEESIKRVIFYSSVSVYGESNEIISVDSEKNPITPYAKSKLLAEEYGIKLYKEKRLPITIIEPVTVYGGDDVGNFEKLKRLAQKGILPRFGDGENKKTVIYYKDLIRVTVKIANDSSNIGTKVICGTEAISYNHIINTFIKCSSKKVFVIKINNGLVNIISKILKVFNFGIAKTLNRQITVLGSNNEYSIETSKKYLNDYMRFENYYK